MSSVPQFTSAMQPATSDEFVCAGVAFIVLLLMGLMVALRSLSIQVGHKPTPTGSPDQHVGFGCIMAALFLFAMALAFAIESGAL